MGIDREKWENQIDSETRARRFFVVMVLGLGLVIDTVGKYFFSKMDHFLKFCVFIVL